MYCMYSVYCVHITVQHTTHRILPLPLPYYMIMHAHQLRFTIVHLLITFTKFAENLCTS